MTNMDIEVTGRRALITVDGPLQADQTIAFIQEHYPKGTFDDALWDLRRSPLIHLMADELRRIADAVRTASAGRRSGRTVFVSNEDAGYGMLRMYTAYAEMEGVPATYYVCRTMEEAEDWLARNPGAG